MSGRTPSIVLASAVTLGAAYVTGSAVSIPNGVKSGTFTIRYTSSTASYPSIIIQMSDGTAWSSLAIVSGTLGVSNARATTAMYEWVWEPFSPTGVVAGDTVSIDLLTGISPKALMRAMYKDNGGIVGVSVLTLSFIGDVG